MKKFISLICALMLIVSSVVFVGCSGESNSFECKTCGDKGQITCSVCDGEKEQECSICFGAGKQQCSKCLGYGSTTCFFCGGMGYKLEYNYLSKQYERKTCFSCVLGRVSCPRETDCLWCIGGERACDACLATGKIDCPDC